MASLAEPAQGWLSFLDERVGAAVRAAAEGDEHPDADALLAEAAAQLRLDALDGAVLAVCAAPELHPRFGRLFAYLQDDVTRRLPSPRLAAELLAGPGLERSDVLGCFGPTARLVRSGALTLLPGDGTMPLADRSAKLADRLAGFLLGAPPLADAGAPVALRRVVADPRTTGRAAQRERISELLGAGSDLPLVVVGIDAAALVSAAAAAPAIVLDIRALEHAGAFADAVLAAALERAVLCLDGLDDLAPPERARLLQAIDEHDGQLVILARAAPAVTALSRRTLLQVDVPLPTFGERKAAWEALTGVDDARDVAAKFRLSLDQIRAAAQVSLVTARVEGRAGAQAADLDVGARQASSSKLGELASQLPPGARWEELVLPDRQRDLLRSVSAYLRHRDLVLSEWGYERTVARTQGIKVLFAGESGTGKTMGAQVLASELGLDLFRVDLATVVSKYIGETEKNLEQIFAAADGSNAILFFDEADALFGKRSEVSDSHDRYANIEVAYLLQRMEGYPGAVILATNFKRNIDDAFLRRLDVVVDFPFPEAPDRRRIWELLLPDSAPVADDVDLDFLAEQFKLSGGAIRNCSLGAAFQAADADTEIGMRHLVLAVAAEYAKQGRLTLEADFAGFHELVRTRGTVS